MNWDEIDNINKEVNYHKYNPDERRKIAPSVQEILYKFDKLISESNVTENDFHQGNEKIVDSGQRKYLQEALRKTLFWQSFCQTST